MNPLGYGFFKHLAERDWSRAKEALENSNLGKREKKLILKRLRNNIPLLNLNDDKRSF